MQSPTVSFFTIPAGVSSRDLRELRLLLLALAGIVLLARLLLAALTLLVRLLSAALLLAGFLVAALILLRILIGTIHLSTSVV